MKERNPTFGILLYTCMCAYRHRATWPSNLQEGASGPQSVVPRATTSVSSGYFLEMQNFRPYPRLPNWTPWGWGSDIYLCADESSKWSCSTLKVANQWGTFSRLKGIFHGKQFGRVTLAGGPQNIPMKASIRYCAYTEQHHEGSGKAPKGAQSLNSPLTFPGKCSTNFSIFYPYCSLWGKSSGCVVCSEHSYL